MVCLKEDIIPPPVFVHELDERTVRGRGHFVEVELYIGQLNKSADLCRDRLF